MRRWRLSVDWTSGGLERSRGGHSRPTTEAPQPHHYTTREPLCAVVDLIQGKQGGSRAVAVLHHRDA
jgi:hypothetical protein